MKLPRSLAPLKRAKEIMKSIPHDLDTAILIIQSEIDLQKKKIEMTLLDNELQIGDRQLLKAYLEDLIDLKLKINEYVDNMKRLGKLKAYNGIIDQVKIMRKKYKKHDERITELCD